jgi:hypothetical protein
MLDLSLSKPNIFGVKTLVALLVLVFRCRSDGGSLACVSVGSPMFQIDSYSTWRQSDQNVRFSTFSTKTTMIRALFINTSLIA